MPDGDPSDPDALSMRRESRRARARERMRDLRHKRRASGLCTECGEPRLPEDPLLCPVCRENSRAKARRSYRLRKGIPNADAPVYGTHHKYAGASELRDETPPTHDEP